jgi:hypothetical protein
MMTEQEAGKRWCPKTFADPTGWNNCLASECMAWRQTHKKGDFVPTEIVRDLHGEKITYKMADDDMGFCGLAGKP